MIDLLTGALGLVGLAAAFVLLLLAELRRESGLPRSSWWVWDHLVLLGGITAAAAVLVVIARFVLLT